MKFRWSTVAALAMVSIVALAGCLAAPNEVGPTASVDDGGLLAQYDLLGLDAQQIIDRLDATPVAERPVGLFASVRPDTLVVSDGAEREVVLPMPSDRFYVSMAPYVVQTHDCYYHSLTTCLGELQDEELEVTVTDASGAVLLEGTHRTFNNGFVGFWLPRDVDASITFEFNGKTVTAPLSTSLEDPTCVTTLQLA